MTSRTLGPNYSLLNKWKQWLSTTYSTNQSARPLFYIETILISSELPTWHFSDSVRSTFKLESGLPSVAHEAQLFQIEHAHTGLSAKQSLFQRPVSAASGKPCSLSRELHTTNRSPHMFAHVQTSLLRSSAHGVSTLRSPGTIVTASNPHRLRSPSVGLRIALEPCATVNLQRTSPLFTNGCLRAGTTRRTVVAASVLMRQSSVMSTLRHGHNQHPSAHHTDDRSASHQSMASGTRTHHGATYWRHTVEISGLPTNGRIPDRLH